MKSIMVKNLTIQFDSFDEGADRFTALNMLDEINVAIKEKFPDAQPQLFVNAIDDDDIEIADDNLKEDDDANN